MLVGTPCKSILVCIAVASFLEDVEVKSGIHPQAGVFADGYLLNDDKIQRANDKRRPPTKQEVKRRAIRSNWTRERPLKIKRQSEAIDWGTGCPNEDSSCSAMKLDEIYKFLNDFARNNADMAKLKQIGRSHEKRPIYAIVINEDSSNVPTIVVEFGMHAREWASPASALYFLQQLANERGVLTTDTRWFIVPVLNPDGYLFSTTRYSLWRKNRNLLLSPECGGGVDLNRNFETGWEVGENNYVCDEVYKGPSPFSEPESRAMRDFVKSIGPSNVDAYIAVHSCAQCVLYPYAYTKNALTESELVLITRAANEMVKAMKKVRNLTYGVMPAFQLDNATSGGSSDDFMFVNLRIPIVLALELGDTSYFDAQDYHHCFHPPLNTTQYLIQECYFALRGLATHINHMQGGKFYSKEGGWIVKEQTDGKSNNIMTVASLASHPSNYFRLQYLLVFGHTTTYIKYKRVNLLGLFYLRAI